MAREQRNAHMGRRLHELTMLGEPIDINAMYEGKRRYRYITPDAKNYVLLAEEVFLNCPAARCVKKQQNI